MLSCCRLGCFVFWLLSWGRWGHGELLDFAAREISYIEFVDWQRIVKKINKHLALILLLVRKR